MCGAHGVGAERAVEPDGEGVGVAHRVPERRRRLAATACGRERSVIVPEIMIGSSKPRSAKIFCAAKMPALVLSVSVMVSNSSRSAPPSISPLIASA